MGKTSKAKPAARAVEVAPEVRGGAMGVGRSRTAAPERPRAAGRPRGGPHPDPRAPRQVATKVGALKSEGNKCFTRRDYVRALEQYEQASKLLPDGAPERVELHNNKAACFYQLRR
jgi:hypothetical protein